MASDLRSAVQRLIAAHRSGDGPEIELCDDLPTRQLAPELRQVMLCILQELLHNACRHSRSKKVLLGLGYEDGRLCAQVQDWGIGFDCQTERPHKRGLKAIRNLIEWLGGTLVIESQRGEGTCVVVELPLPQAMHPDNPPPRLRPR